MRDLLRQFGPSVVVSVVVLIAFGVAAAVVIVRSRHAKRPTLAPAARVLAAGWGVLIVAATGMPHVWPPRWEGLGDLVLVPGRGGFSEWKKVFEDPNSQAALLLVGNVALYMMLAFLATAGWPGRLRRILAGCLILSILVELEQFALLDRVAAVDDVLLNMVGATMGCILGVAIQRLLRARMVEAIP